MKAVTVNIDIVYSKGEPQMPPIVNTKTRGVPVGIFLSTLKQMVETFEEKYTEKKRQIKKEFDFMPGDIDPHKIELIELDKLLEEQEDFDPSNFSQS